MRTKNAPLYFDYENQVWVENGKYIRCGHPDSMRCLCYGKLNEGKLAPKGITTRQYNQSEEEKTMRYGKRTIDDADQETRRVERALRELREYLDQYHRTVLEQYDRKRLYEVIGGKE